MSGKHLQMLAVRLLLAANIVCALCGAGWAGRDKTWELDIPRQKVDAALTTLAEQTGTQLLFPYDMVASRDASPLKGRYTLDEALEVILRGTGLTGGVTSSGVITISLESSAKGREQGDDMEREKKKGILGAVAAAVLSVFSAQNATGQESEEARSAGRTSALEEIIVTAQKREERLIDVPQAMTVLSSDDLAKINALQFRDFANIVPGLSFSTAGAGWTQISLRGVTTGFDVSSTVGIYVDEVPYGMSSVFGQSNVAALDVALFDIERIEVLRGPQGTLYGASTMGGLLKYVTKQPDAESFGVDVRTGVSDTRHGGVSYHGAATVNAPIVTGKAALRVTGFHSHDDGYIDNLALGDKDVNRSNIYGGRADLLLTPTEALNIRITGLVQDVARDGEATADYTFSGIPVDGSLDQHRLFAEPFDQRFRLVSGTVTYDLKWASLTSISSYQTTRREFIWDVSPSYVPLLTSIGRPFSAVGMRNQIATDKFVQEVRFTSEGSGLLEWVVGGFYTHESTEYMQEFILRDLADQPAPNDVYEFFAPTRYDEYAAFGDLTLHLTDKFNVTGGIRYAQSDQKFTQFGSGLFGFSLPTNHSSGDVLTYLANARYHFNDRATGYLRYATGYRPGGPNYVTIDATTGLPIGPETFDPDELKSYEAGFKAETADRRFGVDVASYYVDWSDIQIVVIRGGFGALANSPGGASIRGAELALTARPTAAFVVSGAFAYQDAEMSEANADLGAAKGERLPNVPRFTAAVNVDYDLRGWGSLEPTVGLTVRYVDDRKASFDESTSYLQYHLPDYTTVDLRTGITLGSVETRLYVRNLFDERGQISAFNFRGLPMPAMLQPRTIGVTAMIRF